MIHIMFTHWIADFLFQTRWVATNKYKSLVALTVHCAIYTIVMVMGMLIYNGVAPFVTGLWNGYFQYKLPELVVSSGENYFWFWGVNFVLHWMIDYVTSKRSYMYWHLDGDMHSFISCIGFDQFLHFACLYGTYQWLLSS